MVVGEVRKTMSSVIKVIKRGETVAAKVAESVPSPEVQPSASQMVKTVKSWIAATRERRRAEAEYALSFKREQQHEAA